MDGIIAYINELHPLFIYFALFIAAFLENIIPPIPGDVVVVFGAYLVGIDRLSFTLTYISVTVGSFMGFMAFYIVGYFFSDKISRSKRFKFLHSKHFKTAESLFVKYGLKIILFNRFLSGIRSGISFMSGVYKLDGKYVAIFSLISCMLWNGVLIFLGAIIGRNQGEIIHFVKLYNEIVFVVVIIILLLIIKFKILGNKKKDANL